MTTKADFNAEEWDQVLSGPPAAGLRVVVAHRGGTLRESLEMGRTYNEARANRGSSELLDEIVASQPPLKPGQFGSLDQARTQTLDQIRQAVAVLERKATPDEVDAYKGFIREVAERVASAHKEGGFLGIGGKEVSDEERMALDEVTAALGAGS